MSCGCADMMWEVGSGDCLITKAELRAVLLRPATVTPRGAMQPVTVGPPPEAAEAIQCGGTKKTTRCPALRGPK